MARRRKARVRGPYYDKSRDCWRFVYSDAEGRARHERCPTEAEARAAVEVIRARIAEEGDQKGELTLAQTIDRYELYLRHDKGNKPKSVAETTRRLRAFMLVVAYGDHPIRLLTQQRAESLYERERCRIVGKGDQRRAVATDSHRNVLAEAKTFGRWCAHKRQRILPADPFAEVEGTGRRRKGKLQLRFDEAGKLQERAVASFKAGKMGGVAVIIALRMGLRAGEIVSLRVRDLDCGGSVLWCEGTKTDAARREVPVPIDVRPILTALTEGRDPGAYLLGRRHGTRWVLSAVHDLCAEAGVPRVCTHGLRGTYSSARVARGDSANDVSASMGHEDLRTTLGGSYVNTLAMDLAQQKAAAWAIGEILVSG